MALRPSPHLTHASRSPLRSPGSVRLAETWRALLPGRDQEESKRQLAGLHLREKAGTVVQARRPTHTFLIAAGQRGPRPSTSQEDDTPPMASHKK
ncbi:Muscarinic Acetylcholine Receptor M5 [Manis pentadactyla]|nr:Muscarinic Acetylcholine Receptor M5 [Manis pentadactyla]